MARIHVSLDRPAMRRVVMAHADIHTRRTAELMTGYAKRVVRVKTGAVRNGIGMRRVKFNGAGVTYRIRASHKRSLLEHDGAMPHTILPRVRKKTGRRGLLAFYWARIGQHVVLPRVSHPGTRGSRFLVRALISVGGARGYVIDVDAVRH